MATQWSERNGNCKQFHFRPIRLPTLSTHVSTKPRHLHGVGVNFLNTIVSQPNNAIKLNRKPALDTKIYTHPSDIFLRFGYASDRGLSDRRFVRRRYRHRRSFVRLLAQKARQTLLQRRQQELILPDIRKENTETEPLCLYNSPNNTSQGPCGRIGGHAAAFCACSFCTWRAKRE